jgi:hypothetical protein
MSLNSYTTTLHGQSVTACDTLGTTYYLHTGRVNLKTGEDKTILFFVHKDKVNDRSRPEFKPTTLPSGWRVESLDSGMPVAKK